MHKLKGEIIDLFLHRSLIVYSYLAEIKLLYRGKIFGVLWAWFDPLMLMLTYYFLVKVIFNRGGPGYLVSIFLCIVVWRWFVQSVLGSVKLYISNGKLIQTVRFPVVALPFSKTLVHTTNLLAGMVLMFPMLILSEVSLTIYACWLPVILFVILLFTLGAALIVSYVGVFVRDLQNLLQFSFRVLFYLSPALYDISAIPGKFQGLAMLVNPFAPIFMSLKNVIVYGKPPEIELGIVLLEGLLMVGFGIYLNHYRSKIAKAV